MGRLAELWCGLRRRHDFQMDKAHVIRCRGDEMSDWDAEHTYFLTCRNCDASYICTLPEENK